MRRLIFFSIVLSAIAAGRAQAATNFVGPVQSFSCTNQVTTALAQGTGAFTCSTVTAAMFGSAITAGTVFGNSTGSAGTPSFTATPVLGVGGTTAGTLTFENAAAAFGVTIQEAGTAAASYNFNLPLTVGSAGQALVSEGGGSTPMQWATIASAKFTTSSKTASTYQIATATDDAIRFDNTGASAGVTFTLPTAANTSAGDNWCFTEVANQTITIAVNSTQIITMGNTAGTTGTGTLTSGAVGSTVCLYATSTTNIQTWAANGSWTNN
jgi:hypothetical protein